jgi:hypothetical protein
VVKCINMHDQRTQLISNLSSMNGHANILIAMQCEKLFSKKYEEKIFDVGWLRSWQGCLLWVQVPTQQIIFDSACSTVRTPSVIRERRH